MVQEQYIAMGIASGPTSPVAPMAFNLNNPSRTSALSPGGYAASSPYSAGKSPLSAVSRSSHDRFAVSSLGESLASIGLTPSKGLSAPTGFSSSSEDEGDVVPLVYGFHVRLEDSSDDEDGGELVEGAGGEHGGGAGALAGQGLHPTSAVQNALMSRDRRRRELARAEADRRLRQLEAELAQALAEEELAVAEGERLLEAERARLDAEDSKARQERKARLQQLSVAERQTQQQAAELGSKLQEEADAAMAAKARAEEEERARQEAERIAREGEEKRAAEARAEEARRKAAEDAAAEAEKAAKSAQDAATASAQAEAANAKAAAEAAAAAQAEQAAAVAAAAQARAKASAMPAGVRVAASAMAREKECAEKLAGAQALVRPLLDDLSLKKPRRELDKKITLHVTQISATQSQVVKKANDMKQLVASLVSPQKEYALLVFTSKLLSQCEIQVKLLPSFAFPLALVAVDVCAEVPELVDILLARLHRFCCLSVPKYYLNTASQSGEDFLTKMGYTNEEGVWETTDNFMERLRGYIMFYGAFLQADHPRHPHGIEHAWAWMAQLLNRLPPNRYTATCLDAMVKSAGYKLHKVYGRQFIKILKYVNVHYLDKLKEDIVGKEDSDLGAVVTRLHTYLHRQQYLQSPEGRELPMSDESSRLHA